MLLEHMQWQLVLVKDILVSKLILKLKEEFFSQFGVLLIVMIVMILEKMKELNA